MNDKIHGPTHRVLQSFHSTLRMLLLSPVLFVCDLMFVGVMSHVSFSVCVAVFAGAGVSTCSPGHPQRYKIRQHSPGDGRTSQTE